MTEHGDAAPSPIPRSTTPPRRCAPAARERGDAGGFNLWAGQAHELAQARPAAEIVRELGADARRTIHGFGTATGPDRPIELTACPMPSRLLRRAQRPLVLGMGGGGDIVGALATAEHARIYDGAQPILGGVTWERRPIDPVPGPRPSGRLPAPTRSRPPSCLLDRRRRSSDRDVYFAESRMAQVLGERTVLGGRQRRPQTVADGLAVAADKLDRDLIVFVDVGGDLLAQGDEPGLRSSLCDALMLAAAARLSDAGRPVLAAIFGIGCDAELTPDEVLARLSDVAAAGGLGGARGLTEPVAHGSSRRWSSCRLRPARRRCVPTGARRVRRRSAAGRGRSS